MSSGADASDCPPTSNESQSPVKTQRVDSDRERAKQWTYYIETLKRTTDCIYEICRKNQSVIGCKVINHKKKYIYIKKKTTACD